MRTSFATRTNPFTGLPAENHHGRTKTQHVKVEALSICDDKPLPNRASPEGKYTALLRKIKPGQCIKCPPPGVNRIANAMRKHAKVHGITCHIQSTKDYGDGMGRVWFLAANNPSAGSAGR